MVEIYKQAKNMEKANCDLADTELFVTLKDYKELERNFEIYKEEGENPYCEVCGHCGVIDCCGIVNFIEQHIKGKTNCKNEEYVIAEIISICNYETEVFNENEKLIKQLQAYKDKEDKLREELLIWGEVMNPKLQNKLLQILNDKAVE